MTNLDNVLKYLKNNNSKDPLGLASEIFKPNVAGDDLKLAILLMMNQIKNKHDYPEILRLANIIS